MSMPTESLLDAMHRTDSVPALRVPRPGVVPVCPPAATQPWGKTVILHAGLCRMWRIDGRLEVVNGTGEKPSPGMLLHQSRYLGVLRDELARRGYRLRDGWIDEGRHVGMEVHERQPAGGAA